MSNKVFEAFDIENVARLIGFRAEGSYSRMIFVKNVIMIILISEVIVKTFKFQL